MVFLVMRYGVTGFIGALIQIGSLYVGVSLFGLEHEYLFVVAIGFCIALSVTFPLQKYWTFRDGAHHRAPRQLAWYSLIAICSLLANTLLLALARDILEALRLDFFHLWYLMAEALILIFVAATSFFINMIHTFRESQARRKIREE